VADQVALPVDPRLAERVELDDPVDPAELFKLTTRRRKVEAEVRHGYVVPASRDYNKT
jgi:hypothetical protein